MKILIAAIIGNILAAKDKISTKDSAKLDEIDLAKNGNLTVYSIISKSVSRDRKIAETTDHYPALLRAKSLVKAPRISGGYNRSVTP